MISTLADTTFSACSWRWAVVAISSTMTIGTADSTADFGSVDVLLLLRAGLRHVTKLIAVVTFGNTSVHWNTSFPKSLEIFLSRDGPTLLHDGTLGLVAGEVGDGELLAGFALEIHNRQSVAMVFFLYERKSLRQLPNSIP